jgi:hypothetical protein
MAKHKKKQVKADAAEGSAGVSGAADVGPSAPGGRSGLAVDGGAGTALQNVPSALREPTGETEAAPAPDTHVRAVAAVSGGKARWRHCLSDLVKAALALAVIAVAAVIWYEPPLVAAEFPQLSYTVNGQRFEDAVLYRPLAMPTRYYVVLPRKLEDRYAWFAVDRRREVVALVEAPQRTLMGRRSIRRSDPLGMDLEFRKLDGSEWRIAFLKDAIVFSNAVLAVRLDAQRGAAEP